MHRLALSMGIFFRKSAEILTQTFVAQISSVSPPEQIAAILTLQLSWH
jgi:hypothetical protein